MTGVRELSLELPHLRLAAQAWGDPQLPCLLALHGWLDNAASFDRLAPLLCEHFHIVALDLPGHGRSGHRPPGTWYHYVDYLGDTLAAADALGWTQFGLLGHSLGGAVASMLAAASPQRIERLFLIEALGPLTAEVEQTLTLLQRAISQRHGLPAKALRVFSSEAEAAQTRAKAGDLSLEAAQIMVARGIKSAPGGGFVWSSDRAPDADVTAALYRGPGARGPRRTSRADATDPGAAGAAIPARGDDQCAHRARARHRCRAHRRPSPPASG
jgi:pimeloyl-ACP methyl ester carboxylesterase